MTKRRLLTEISEGFEALAEQRLGKTTLRTVEVDAKPAPEVSAEELKAIREKPKLSRPVFATCAPTPERSKTGSKAVPSLMHKLRC